MNFSKKTLLKDKIKDILKTAIPVDGTFDFKVPIPVEKDTVFIHNSGGCGLLKFKATSGTRITGISRFTSRTYDVNFSEEDAVVEIKNGIPASYHDAHGRTVFFTHDSVPLASLPIELMEVVHESLTEKRR